MEYLKAVATSFVASVSSIQKGVQLQLAVRSKSVPWSPVSDLFLVHATGPLNTNLYPYSFGVMRQLFLSCTVEM